MSGRRLREAIKEVRNDTTSTLHMKTVIITESLQVTSLCCYRVIDTVLLLLCYNCVVTVSQELESQGTLKDMEVVIAGLSNVYTHYITTYEEYQVHIC